jgi:hypothetical protein
MQRLKTSLFATAGLAEPSIFYRHYLFEALGKLGLMEKIQPELKLWSSFLDAGFRTAPETPVNKTFNQRSDCHGWGAHPLYHLITGIAGIKPAAMGFKAVLIQPQLGPWREVTAQCIHPQGMISARYVKEGTKLVAEISLPEGTNGLWRIGENYGELASGDQQFSATLP